MDEERRWISSPNRQGQGKCDKLIFLLLHLGDKLNSLLPSPPTSQSIGHRYEVRPLFRATIDQKQVIQKRNSIQVQTSAGPDDVNPKLLMKARRECDSSVINTRVSTQPP